jgi:hypothetical protein
VFPTSYKAAIGEQKQREERAEAEVEAEAEEVNGKA